ncbi:MAG TPA: NAD(P)H-quinone oxidoreductase [Tepidiformaceae bacterium]
MHAITIADRTLNYSETPDPTCGPEDLLVRVKAAGLNRADLLQRRGSYPQPGVAPVVEIPGLEYAGEVIALGERVQGFAIGDRVMGLLAGGGYAEQVAVNHRLAVKVPANLSWIEAGATPEVFITAHDALLQCDFTAGETFLIHAAGSGVGVAATQIAKAMGASMVIGTAGSQEKLDRARALGLDIGIDYHTQDFAEEVKKATDGRGVDVILDVIGADYFERNLRSLATKGRMIIVGTLSGGNITANIGLLSQRRASVRGTLLRARVIEEKAYATRAFEKSVLPHLANGRIGVPIDRVFPLNEAGAAQAYMETNANFGKIVLEM